MGIHSLPLVTHPSSLYIYYLEFPSTITFQSPSSSSSPSHQQQQEEPNSPSPSPNHHNEPDHHMGFSQWTRGPIVGRGSSATVSLAIDSLTGHAFAVKSVDLCNSAFLQREQRFLSSIDSPHVVSYLGFDVTSEGTRPPVYNLLMEYLPCGSVADEIARRGGKGLEECAIRSYLHGVLMGLSYLHSRGIAHCDVKGRNVLLAADGAAKLADFGCARWVGGQEHGRPSIGGTPVFMAPEVARGEEQGTAADVWAVGCTVIEMATGRPPWPDASDPVSAMHRIAFSGDVPDVPEGISDEGRDFLRRCLSRDPEQRWSADQLLQHPFVAANPIIGGEPICSPNPYWKSPKCVLDQDIWNSLDDDVSDADAEAEDQSPVMGSDPFERIRQLSDRRDGGADASTTTSSWPSWDDEDWITIRSGSSDCSSSSCSGGGAAAAVESNGDRNRETERNTLFSLNHIASDHLFLISDSLIPDHSNIVNLGDFPHHQQSYCCSCYSCSCCSR